MIFLGLESIHDVIDKAAAHINNMTGGCITYTPYTNQKDFVHLWYGSG